MSVVYDLRRLCRSGFEPNVLSCLWSSSLEGDVALAEVSDCFVTALLDNLFGIQSRAGCMCAGPYAQDLLGIGEYLATEFENLLVEDSRLDRHQLSLFDV